MSLNRVEIIGGLTKPPELRYTQGGYPFATFTVAVNGTRYDSQEGKQVVTTAFISCQLWGPNAEDLAEELEHAKGEQLYVFGELDQSDWEDKEGKKQSRTRVKVFDYRRLSPKREITAPRQRATEESWEAPAEEAPF